MADYNAKSIKALDPIEAIRKRSGMYVGGADKAAMALHLFKEVVDNSMDEVGTGSATRIDVKFYQDGNIEVSDNGRGIPVDAHPKYPELSALEVIMTTLHSGGKFDNEAYATAGGLHGVGLPVVNALSSKLLVRVKRDKGVFEQSYARGEATSKLTKIADCTAKEHGTTIIFHPDPEIFGEDAVLDPGKLYETLIAKAYLFKGINIHWSSEVPSASSQMPIQEDICFPNGIKDFLEDYTKDKSILLNQSFVGEVVLAEGGKVEWAITWLDDDENFSLSYCNTIPTPQGGTHDLGLRQALLKGIRASAEMLGHKKAQQITSEDALKGIVSILSVFIPAPSFQGQSKEKLLNQEVTRMVEVAVRDRFDHWLSGNINNAKTLIEAILNNLEDRLNRKQSKTERKTALKSIRLPGKLTDCSRKSAEGTEIFLVEGDSAGGSAKQARDRENQAILPLKGKILNVASNSLEKIRNNNEIEDMIVALGCGVKENYRPEKLRYDRVIIMTDADVDGAHIAALLMTFFFLQMPKLIDDGHLYLAQPPLYRIKQGQNTYYAKDDKEKDKLAAQLSKGKGSIEVGRFKGLGEMTPGQLKETTMHPKSRTLLRVAIDDADWDNCAHTVEELMGKRPEARFKFIQAGMGPSSE